MSTAFTLVFVAAAPIGLLAHGLTGLQVLAVVVSLASFAVGAAIGGAI